MSHATRSSQSLGALPLSESEDYQIETKRFGMWVFLAMETLFFGGILFLYTSERYRYPIAFEVASAHLKLWLAGLNTAVLLTSSLSMALAVFYLDQKRRRACFTALLTTAALGTAFLILKAYEYFLDFKEGTLPISIGGHAYHPIFAIPKEGFLFYSLYLFLTSLHAVHLTLGIVWCLVVAMRVRNTAEPFTESRGKVDILGLYWHFVDIVWIFLLPLLYMVGDMK